LQKEKYICLNLAARLFLPNFTTIIIIIIIIITIIVIIIIFNI